MVGNVVVLDGSASSDADGDSVPYGWLSKRNRCFGLATIYYQGVSNLGWGAYVERQEQFCATH